MKKITLSLPAQNTQNLEKQHGIPTKTDTVSSPITSVNNKQVPVRHTQSYMPIFYGLGLFVLIAIFSVTIILLILIKSGIRK